MLQFTNKSRVELSSLNLYNALQCYTSVADTNLTPPRATTAELSFLTTVQSSTISTTSYVFAHFVFLLLICLYVKSRELPFF
jgi:hypothetical protein